MLVIVDYGLGNLGSILNMLKTIGTTAVISSEVSVIESASKLILPGVGAFDNGIQNLAQMGLLAVLERKVIDHKCPILGICLGMQLLGRGSEEGTLPGLGWIDAETVRFRFAETNSHLKIPHMGWNTIKQEREHLLLEDMYPEPRFYFVHSYHMMCYKQSDVLATSNYGFHFTSIVGDGNIMGVQFHPEKSHKFGMQLLKNFAEKE